MKIGPLHIPIYRLVIHLTVIITFSIGFIRSVHRIDGFILTPGNITVGFVSFNGAVGGGFIINSGIDETAYISNPTSTDDVDIFQISFLGDHSEAVLVIGWPYIIITYALASITYAIIRLKRETTRPQE